MSERYNVVLEGRVRPEADREAVIPDLAALVGRDAVFARGLLSGRPVVLRSGIALADAESAVEALRRIGVLARHEPAPDLQIDADVDARLQYRPRARLWNPNAAAAWSLLFTPVFGAALHWLNWQALQRTDEAARSRTWFVVSVVVLVASMVSSIVMPASDGSLRIVGLVWLLVWYFTAARTQVRYVKQELADDYIHRAWWRPLLLAVGVVIATMFVVGWMTDARVERTGPTRTVVL